MNFKRIAECVFFALSHSAIIRSSASYSVPMAIWSKALVTRTHIAHAKAFVSTHDSMWPLFSFRAHELNGNGGEVASPHSLSHTCVAYMHPDFRLDSSPGLFFHGTVVYTCMILVVTFRVAFVTYTWTIGNW